MVVLLLFGGCAPFASSSTTSQPQPNTDASVGAGADVDASVVVADGGVDAPFCAQHRDATACIDYDVPDATTSSIPIGWTLFTTDGSAITLSSDAFSTPNAIDFSLVDIPSTDAADARLRTNVVPKSIKRVQMTFAVKIKEVSALQGTQQVSLMEIFCATGATNTGAWLELRANGAIGVEIDGLFTPVTQNTGGWMHLGLDAQFPGSKSSVSVLVNGASVAELNMVNCPTSDIFEVNVGLGTYTHASGRAVYDDILYQIDP